MTVSPRLQRAIEGKVIDTAVAGQWRVTAYPAGQPVDISMFRGMPVKIGDFAFSDPFGAKDMTIMLEQVSIFDRLGERDLFWCAKHVDVDVEWVGDIPDGYPFGMNDNGVVHPAFHWEGYISSLGRSSDGLTLQLKGANYQLDNHLAKPEYVTRPLPYEWAIARQFLNKPSLRLHPLRIIWPEWWTKKYVPVPKAPSYMIPAGVGKGQNWTGLTTRSTGTWDPVLTSYIQSLLAAMYTERGRWTIDLDINRQPVMMHRDFVSVPNASTVIIDPIDPGVTIESLDEDWEQTLTDVYGQGTSLSGVAFSGMQVSGDGSETFYVPLAARRQTYPPRSDNGWYDEHVMVKEVMLQMQQGLSADDAAIVARAHLTRFAEPGQTGTVVLESDPVMNGVVIPRHLVRAGMQIQIPHVLGRPEGILGHVTDSKASLENDNVTLTFDTKHRDALTAEEVRLRGRDALSVARMLVAGQYQPPVPDQLYPWSYEAGSGYIPSNSSFNAKPLFDGMPSDMPFPWSEWTTQRPPKDGRWKNSYLRIGAAQGNASKNWFTQHSAWGSNMGAPIRMAQAGQIRLLQVAAYDADGNVLRVPFHISFYYIGAVNVQSMPQIPAEQAALFPPYAPGQKYPFVRDGFEAYKIDGTRNSPKIPQPIESVGLLKAYGNFYEKAGFWPGSYAEGDEPTGLLVDESGFSFDITSVGDAVFDPYSVERNLTNTHSGQLYAMIYCDAQQDQEVFFLGRMFRTEPGQGG